MDVGKRYELMTGHNEVPNVLQPQSFMSDTVFNVVPLHHLVVET